MRPDGIDAMHAVCNYEGAGRELVLALKRGNRRDGVPLLGESLAGTISASGVALDGVTWAPTTPKRRRRRGFDQSKLLAAAVARNLGMGPSRCLRRSGGAQMGLDAADRLGNPDFTAVAPGLGGLRSSIVGRFSDSGCSPTSGVLSGTWVLVDDVVTTGATMSAAARTLRAAGAESVIGAAIAVAR